MKIEELMEQMKKEREASLGKRADTVVPEKAMLTPSGLTKRQLAQKRNRTKKNVGSRS